MSRLLSDRRTFWFKLGPFAFATALMIAMLVGPALRLPHPAPAQEFPFDPNGLLGVLIAVWASVFWGLALYGGWKIKSVKVEGDILVIGGFRQEITVPLYQVAEVGTTGFGRFGKIELHGDSEFGSSIWFIPSGGSEGLFAPPRSILELRALVGQRMGDRSAILPPPVDFAHSWSRLRWWSWAQRLSFLGLVLSGIFVIPTHQNEPFWFLYAAPFMLGLMVTGGVLANWACPQCGQKFFYRTWANRSVSIFSRSCGNCGLQQGAPAPSLPPTTG